MKIILKIKEGGHSLPVNKSQTRKDTFANTKVVAIIVVFTVGVVSTDCHLSHRIFFSASV